MEAEGLTIGLDYFVKIAPVVVVLGLWIKYLLEELSVAQKQLSEEKQNSKEMEIENLKVLRDLSTILKTLLEESRGNNKEIISMINDLKDQIDVRSEKLQEHIRLRES